MRFSAAILIMFSSFAWSQSAATQAGTFKITQTNPVISTSTISGKQSYQVIATSQGFTIKGNLWVADGETPILADVEDHLAPDWSLQHYTFNGVVAGINQKIEAWVDNGQAEMQFTAERSSPRRTLKLRPNTVVLDNFVPSNFQVLLNEFAVSSVATPTPQSREFYLLVPQKMMALKATLTRAGSDSALLNGKETTTAKYTLQMSSGTAQIWTDDRNHVLGVYFEDGDIEYLQSGFELPQLKVAMERRLPRERVVDFLSDGRQLLGTLMLPPENLGRQEKYPVVVMAGGFGPVDRDGTIGKSKPLRDLATGLAYKGFATLRYDKPAYSFHGRIDPRHITLENDAIDAAVNAVKYAQSRPEIDSRNIFFLGYSEGGEVAPNILEQSPEVRGAVLMAAPGRPPDQFVPQQLAADLQMKGAPSADVDARVAAAKKQFAEIRLGTLPDDTLVLGYPASFWRSLMAREHLRLFHQIKTPVLLLQGDQDIQLSKTDYELLRAAIPADKVEAQYFVGLNHIFSPAPAGSNGSEMMIGSHVAGQVIGTIADWIQNQVTRHGEPSAEGKLHGAAGQAGLSAGNRLQVSGEVTASGPVPQRHARKE